jgi:antitoxin ParD1/3/4
MNVNVTDAQEALVRRAVAEGGYASASEVVRYALRLFEVEYELRQGKLAAVRNAVDASMRDLQRGDVLTAAQAHERFSDRIDGLFPD